MPRPREYPDDLRKRLIDSAAALLAAEGPQAISTRRVAAVAGTSTTAIYTLIGPKEELVRTMYLEGFRRLAARQDLVPSDLPPKERLIGLGCAYIESGLASPHLYSVMFGRPVPEFCPSEEDAAFALTTLQQLAEAVEACIDAGLVPGPREALVQQFWAFAHGLTSLAIAGMLDPDAITSLLRDAATVLLQGTGAS